MVKRAAIKNVPPPQKLISFVKQFIKSLGLSYFFFKHRITYILYIMCIIYRPNNMIVVSPYQVIYNLSFP